MREALNMEHEVMPPRCPLDGLGLMIANSDGACRCPQCDGLWLPGPLISNCVGNEVTKALKGTRGEATPLTCPDDQLNLTKIRFHGIDLDLCTECCGVWFDRKDLDGIHQHRQALGIDTGAEIPVYVECAEGEGSWEDSLVHFILFAARG